MAFKSDLDLALEDPKDKAAFDKAEAALAEFYQYLFNRHLRPYLKRYDFIMVWGNGAAFPIRFDGSHVETPGMERLAHKLESLVRGVHGHAPHYGAFWEICCCIEPNIHWGPCKTPGWAGRRDKG